VTLVSLHDLTKTYPDAGRSSVAGLNLQIPDGKLTVLLGPSGCGKTTVMKMIAGLLDPTSGDIRFDGRSVIDEPPDARGAVMVFQNHLLFPFMTVAENIGFGLKMRHTPTAEIARRVGEMLVRMQLSGLGHRRPADLSGGQQQRVALARALILKPKVLLLDEPLSNLDAHLRLEMRGQILALQREMAITTVLVTHDQEEAVMLADQIALILDGRLRQDGPAETFYGRPADVDVARFFGGCNFVPGQASGGLFTSALGPLRLPEEAATGPGTLTFRPEAVEIGDGGENTVTATVTDCMFLGTQTRVFLRAGDHPIEMLARPANTVGLAPGQAIRIRLPRNSLWVLPPENLG
jgi:ABC-type sugar transport system ATPase subunit